jgi:hypothetical protein
VGCGLWVVGCGLWVVGCGLWVVGCGLWVVGCVMVCWLSFAAVMVPLARRASPPPLHHSSSLLLCFSWHGDLVAQLYALVAHYEYYGTCPHAWQATV